MTQNQIAYKNAAENQRHNQAVEQENYRHNFINEKLQNVSNALQKYQIAVNNLHYTRMDNETARANRESERIRDVSNQLSAATLSETSRHQKTIESLQAVLNKSTQAVNYAHATDFYADAGLKEAQTNTEQYKPGQIINQIDLTNAEANLAREKLGTEKTHQIYNVTGSVRNVTSSVGDIFSAVGNLITGGKFNPASSGSWAQNYFEQFNRQLDKAN